MHMRGTVNDSDDSGDPDSELTAAEREILEADMRAFLREESGRNVDVRIHHHKGIVLGRPRHRSPWYVRLGRWLTEKWSP